MRHTDRSWWQDHTPVGAAVGLSTGRGGGHHFDLTIVGAGGAGLSCALEAAQSGLHVAVIDIEGPGSGAAGRNGGLLLAGFAWFYHDAEQFYGVDNTAVAYQLTLEELARVRELELSTVRWTGSVRRAFDAAEQRDLVAHHEALTRAGFPSKLISNDELEIPTDGLFNPLDRARNLATMAQEMDVSFFLGHAVTRVDTGAVHLSNGDVVTSDAIAVCVDGGLEQLLPELKGRVTSRRLQMIATSPVDVVETQAVYRRGGHDYMCQAPDGSLLFGGYRDADPEANITTVAAAGGPVIDYLEAWAHEVQPDAQIVNRWAGACAWTDDGLPICEEVRPGVWAAGAYAGTGNLWSTMCGRAIAHEIFRPRTLIAASESEVVSILRKCRDYAHDHNVHLA